MTVAQIEQRRAKRRRHYQRHREAVLARLKHYYQAHREKISVYQRKYRELHREELKRYEVEYRKTHPDKRQRGDYNYFLRLKKKRGMSRQDYADLLAVQHGKCAICLQTSSVKLHVDHDHKTGRVRGLLCSLCNTSLGMVERVGVEPIVAYIERTK